MIDFYAAQQALLDLLKADATVLNLMGGRLSSFFLEMMDRDLAFHNMPLINVRLKEAQTDLITLPNGYYAFAQYEVDIAAFDLSEFKKAAKVRDDILKAAMLAVRSQPSFGGSSSSKIGANISFEAGTPEQGGGHMAIATFRVVTETYVDP